jgi:hypothetical protein
MIEMTKNINLCENIELKISNLSLLFNLLKKSGLN